MECMYVYCIEYAYDKLCMNYTLIVDEKRETKYICVYLWLQFVWCVRFVSIQISLAIHKRPLSS